MMNLKQVRTGATSLSNLLHAGVSVHRATSLMSRYQPDFAEFWQRATDGVAEGRQLSVFLEEVWPTTFLKAVKSGEESGKLPDVLKKIRETIELQESLYSMLTGLLYPIVLMLAGIGIFIFFMLSVIPSLAKSLGLGKHGLVFELSSAMTKYFNQYWIPTVAGIVLTTLFFIYWFSIPENREKLLGWVLLIPGVNRSLRLIFFGLWARYMALVSGTGAVSFIDSLKMTTDILPITLRDGMTIFAEEAVQRGLSDASDPDKQPDGDPRKIWPLYIGNAFSIYDETGKLDLVLASSAESMIDEGKLELKILLNIMYAISLASSALFIAGPLAAYYTQMGVAMADAMK